MLDVCRTVVLLGQSRWFRVKFMLRGHVFGLVSSRNRWVRAIALNVYRTLKAAEKENKKAIKTALQKRFRITLSA